MAAAAAQLERDLAAISLRDLAAIELSISPAISAAEIATSLAEDDLPRELGVRDLTWPHARAPAIV